MRNRISEIVINWLKSFLPAQPLTAAEINERLAGPPANVKTASQLRAEAKEAEKRRLGAETYARQKDSKMRVEVALERTGRIPASKVPKPATKPRRPFKPGVAVEAFLRSRS